MGTIQDLAALQELEQALAKNAARLQEIERLLVEPQGLILARKVASEAEDAVANLHRSLRSLEAEAMAVRTKRDTGRERLYSGAITNPRELQDLEAESKALGRRLSRLEDQILDLMIEIDQATESRNEKSSQLVALETEHVERTTMLKGESQTLETEATQLRRDVQQLRTYISKDVLGRYEALRARKGGRAVARLRGGICQACGVQVPTHAAQRALQGQDMVTCPSCSRLLCPD